MSRITFLGATETVTGSKYLLEAGGAKVLFDCGMFQGMKALRQLNWEPLPFEAGTVDKVVLTHAHIDHTGFLPRFFKLGYTGEVFCTPATRDLTGILLLDSANCQEMDAKYANKKGFSKHHPALPLYDEFEAAEAIRQLRARPLNEWFQAAGPIWCKYHDAGHLLGSTMIEVQVREGAKPLTILFSGDVGRYDAPLYHDPSEPPPCDYLICESTYGNRDHPTHDAQEQLVQAVNDSLARGGMMLVASFAVGRAQQLIYLLNLLIAKGRIPKLPIYLDSPMAVKAMQVYLEHEGDQDFCEAQSTGMHNYLANKNVRLVSTSEESKALNDEAGPGVIIASSGMMTGGRILHHLKRRLPDPRTTVLLVGFMSEGSRGRQIQDGARHIRIHGADVPVHAAVSEISVLSGHAGHSELVRWLKPLPAPRQTFITHGEKASATAFADELRRNRNWNTHVPKLGEVVELETPA